MDIKLRVHVIPNSKENRIEGYDEWRKAVIVKIRAPPSEGRANRELERFLSKFFGTEVRIISGEKSRDKIVLISEICEDEIHDKLGGL